MKSRRTFIPKYILITLMLVSNYAVSNFPERISFSKSDEKNYFIIVASFKEKSNAYNEISRLKNAGYDSPELIFDKKGNNYRVSILKFDSKNQAINKLLEIRKKQFPDCWILYESSPNFLTPNRNSGHLKAKNGIINDSHVISSTITSTERTYYVITGSFKEESSAYFEKIKLIKLGYKNASVLEKNQNNFLVSIESFKSLEKARIFLNSLKNNSNNISVIKLMGLNKTPSASTGISSNEQIDEIIQEEEDSLSAEDQKEDDQVVSSSSNEQIDEIIQEEEDSLSAEDQKDDDQAFNSPGKTFESNLLKDPQEFSKEKKSKRRKSKRSEQKNIFLAKKDYENLNYNDAQNKYLEILKSGKESKEAVEYLANSYYNNSQYEKAVTWFNKLISAYSEEISPETFYKASISFKSLGAYEISNELLERYLELTDNIVIKNYYKKNKDYLSLIKEEGLDFEITLSNINSENSDFGPSFFGEKQLIYSSSIDGKGDEDFQWSGEPFLDLFLADIDSLGNLQNPIKLEGNINTRFHESSASSTRNKNKIYFTRNNFIEGKIGRDAQNRINLKIYSAESNDGKTWNNIKELPFNDDSYSCAHPTLNSQENRLYFTSNMPGSFGLSDIWYVEILDDDKFGPPINLGPLVNTEFRESFPFIGKNDILYFSSDGRIGLGGLDVYYTNLDKNGFPINSKNIGEPINSRLDDFGLIYNENTNLGYFSSNRKGIWGSKSDEIYKINKKECNPIIEGIIIDEFTSKPVGNALVKLSDSEGNMISETIVGDDAKFIFSNEIFCGKSYSIEVSKFPGYSKEKITVLIPNYSSQVNEEIKLNWSSDCIPSDLICLLDINPILFDLNKYYINSKAAKELKKIYAAMIKYPNLKINISSHTDSRGSTSYNKKLSENRAISTKNWLVKRGIDQDRLFTNSFGEVDLENYCEDNVDCREEEHMINRRSVFTIK